MYRTFHAVLLSSPTKPFTGNAAWCTVTMWNANCSRFRMCTAMPLSCPRLANTLMLHDLSRLLDLLTIHLSCHCKPSPTGSGPRHPHCHATRRTVQPTAPSNTVHLIEDLVLPWHEQTRCNTLHRHAIISAHSNTVSAPGGDLERNTVPTCHEHPGEPHP